MRSTLTLLIFDEVSLLEYVAVYKFLASNTLRKQIHYQMRNVPLNIISLGTNQVKADKKVQHTAAGK